MERYDWDRYDNGGYRNEDSYNDQPFNWHEQYRRDGFERGYYNNRNHEQESGPVHFRNYRSHHNDRDQYRRTDYRDDYRSGNPELMGNIRQGYGISGYDGTSDRFNTLKSEHRMGDAQDEQPYYGGNRDGYRSSRFGGGPGEASAHSDRGIPNYGLHNFADSEGTGMGSSYGGSNYGPGTGYMSGNRGGSFGENSYGTNSGNYGGFGPMGGSSYGGGRSSYGDISHNSDRGATELGGFNR